MNTTSSTSSTSTPAADATQPSTASKAQAPARPKAEIPVKASSPKATPQTQRAKPAAKKPATKSAVKPAAKPTVKATLAKAPKSVAKSPAPASAPSKAKPTAQKAAKPALKKQAVAPVKPLKDKKIKVVRDSFTIPKNELMQIAEMKKRALTLGVEIKKSELIRAGLQALVGMTDAAFKNALASVPTIKTGRPAKN